MNGAPPGGLPGLRGPDHLGITVPDLDAALGFLSGVLGCGEVYRRGPFADPRRPTGDDRPPVPIRRPERPGQEQHPGRTGA